MFFGFHVNGGGRSTTNGDQFLDHKSSVILGLNLLRSILATCDFT